MERGGRGVCSAGEGGTAERRTWDECQGDKPTISVSNAPTRTMAHGARAAHGNERPPPRWRPLAGATGRPGNQRIRISHLCILLRSRAHSAARHMRETAIVNFRPGINDYRYITVANTLLNLILLHHGLQVCRTTAITTKSEQSAQWIDVHAALLNLFAREPHDARGDDPTCAISRRQW